MFCPKCGKSVVEGAAFCKYCGAKILRRSAAGKQGAPAGRPVRPTGRSMSGAGSQGARKRQQSPQRPAGTGKAPKRPDGRTVRIMAAAAGAVLLIAAFAGTAYAVSPARRASRQVSIGDRYLSELDYDQAMVAYENAISIDPKSEDAYKGVVDAALAKAEKLGEEEADERDVRDLYEKAADAIVRADEEEVEIDVPPEVIDVIEIHIPEDHPIHSTKGTETTAATETETETETVTETETETETETVTETETETETVTETENATETGTETVTETETATETETVTETETATETETVPTTETQDQAALQLPASMTWQDVYRTYIGENRAGNRVDLYALGFMDGDEIPELFHTSLDPETYEGTEKILSFRDGQLVTEDVTNYENLVFRPRTGQMYVSYSDGGSYVEGTAVYRDGHIVPGDLLITDSGTGEITWKGAPVEDDDYYAIADELYATADPGQPVEGFFTPDEMLAYLDLQLPAGTYNIGWAMGDGGMMGLLRLSEDGTFTFEGAPSVLSDELEDGGEEISVSGTYRIENAEEITKARIAFESETANFSFPYVGMTEGYRYLHYEAEDLYE